MVLSKGKNMILWSIQNGRAYEKMKQVGVLRADKNYILDDLFQGPYLWMSNQRQKRIGKAPEEVAFPVWAWYQWEGHRKRPDMRTHGRNWGEKGIPIVLLTIDVPEQYALLSDFDYWHCALNDMDIIFPYDETMVYSEAEKRKSWENIFDIDCTFDSEVHRQLTT